MNTPREADEAQGGHPYQRLTPDVVLDALASVGLYGDGRLVALSSYENRVYQVALEEPLDLNGASHASVVVKFYRPGRWSDAQILEEHAFAAELMAAEVPVVGPLTFEGSTLHHFDDFAFSVSPRRGGRAPELDDFEVLEWIGRFVARIHNVGAARPFAERPALDLQSFGSASREFLLEHGGMPMDVQREWGAACADALQLIAESDLLTSGNGRKVSEKSPHPDSASEPIAKIRLHGDCHPGNILWTPAGAPGEGPHFVDLDDCRTGPAVQDLWMLLSGERADRTMQLSALLDGYEQLRRFDRRELKLIEPLRTLRLIHYSAWLARRWRDPTFPIHFPYFGTSDYWRGQIRMLEEQCEAMQEQPLSV
ncbi:MAG: serine/threonine protein kinase [Burkholderiales bacterium]